MTITIDRATIGEDGTLKLPKEALDALGTREVRLEIDSGRMIVAARPRKLHEIENFEERMRAFEAFVKRVSRPTGVTWPEGYDVTDDVYD